MANSVKSQKPCKSVKNSTTDSSDVMSVVIIVNNRCGFTLERESRDGMRVQPIPLTWVITSTTVPRRRVSTVGRWNPSPPSDGLARDGDGASPVPTPRASHTINECNGMTRVTHYTFTSKV